MAASPESKQNKRMGIEESGDGGSVERKTGRAARESLMRLMAASSLKLTVTAF
jgi:hypothetical protein